MNNAHLTVDQIIDFVSMTNTGECSRELIDTVNNHICECADCRKTLRAFITVADEFKRLSKSGDIDKEALKKLFDRDMQK